LNNAVSKRFGTNLSIVQSRFRLKDFSDRHWGKSLNGNCSKSRYAKNRAWANIMVSSSCINILLIEDNPAEARLLREILKGSQGQTFEIVHVQRLADGLQKATQQRFDVILLDLTLPDSEGLSSLIPLMESVPDLPIVVLTNHNDDHLALDAVRAGAQDYLVKRNASLELLVRSICYAIERKQVAEKLRRENQSLEASIKQRTAELTKAQELNQLKSEFVSMLSHDFRNPLNTILLSAGLLEESRDRLTPEQQVNYFQMIRNAIKDMDQLLTEVLLLGRSDSGKLKCHFIPLNLEEFCGHLVDNINQSQQPIYGHCPIIFRCLGELPSELWDTNLVRHILNNLLTNAVKYSAPKGVVYFDLMVEQDVIVFQITDQGIGIPPEALPKLFNPFYRAENVDNIAGTGLGLTIVQRCVEVYGGKITVVSELNQGTTFTVTLPRQKDLVVVNQSSVEHSYY
jgi:signal transduction histidine kinase